jgi:splicing factor 4
MLIHHFAGKLNTSVPSDPVALMEFYAKRAAQEERKRPLRQSKDEMPPPPSLQGTFFATLFAILEEHKLQYLFYN